MWAAVRVVYAWPRPEFLHKRGPSQVRILGRGRPATPLRKYARALYWSVRSIITLGFDDVTPVINVETIFGIVIQIIGAVFNTLLIATSLFVFRYLNSRKQVFMTRVDEAKEYTSEYEDATHPRRRSRRSTGAL